MGDGRRGRDGIKEKVEEAEKASLFTNNEVATVQSKTKGDAISADSMKTLPNLQQNFDNGAIEKNTYIYCFRITIEKVVETREKEKKHKQEYD